MLYEVITREKEGTLLVGRFRGIDGFGHAVVQPPPAAFGYTALPSYNFV